MSNHPDARIPADVDWDERDDSTYDDVIENFVQECRSNRRANARDSRSAREVRDVRLRRRSKNVSPMATPPQTNSDGGSSSAEEMETSNSASPIISSATDLTIAIRHEEPRLNNTTTTVTRRPRGRPRIHPLPDPRARKTERTKTGCLTCRQRKKKCDEMKPACRNCDKGGFVCAGYEPKKVFQTPAQRLANITERSVLQLGLYRPLPHVIIGVDTASDKIFFKHYLDRLSPKFTVEDSSESSFQRIVLPIAQDDPGLMHSLLSLASKHMDFESGHGRQLREQYGDVTLRALHERSEYHNSKAAQILSVRQERSRSAGSSALILQVLCSFLQTLTDAPNDTGAHRIHLAGLLTLEPQLRPEEDKHVIHLVKEFTAYHVSADKSMRHPNSKHQLQSLTRQGAHSDSTQISNSVRLLGIDDNIFEYMARITDLRNVMRVSLQNRDTNPSKDYNLLFEAQSLRNHIQDWLPQWSEGDPRNSLGLDRLHQLMMGVYLFHTIYPPELTNWQPEQAIIGAVDDAIEILNHVPADYCAQTILLKPTFFIGWGAFYEYQREGIRKAIRAVRNYMEFRNADTALMVLEEVWRRMDARDPSAWDVPSVALYALGVDFLAT